MNLRDRFSDTAIVSTLFILSLAFLPSAAFTEENTEKPIRATMDKDGTLHIPEMRIPTSMYMSEEAKQALIDFVLDPPPIVVDEGIKKMRETFNQYWISPFLEKAINTYPVNIEEQIIAGVRTDVITPKNGISKHNQERVLINLHGGGFEVGNGGLGGQLESVPLASLAKIKIVAIDYRQGPEYKFPAASEDVAAVYEELLKKYKPENIGIYGCSAGGALTAMAIAWFQKEKLPLPGAIGIFCANADAQWGGDSEYLGALLIGYPVRKPEEKRPRMEYLSETNFNDPLLAPTVSSEILSQFPPTLLITGTRSQELSSTIYTHRQLLKVGVEAELQIWNGMWHAFFVNPNLPESREAYDVMVKFFDKHLGQSN